MDDYYWLGNRDDPAVVEYLEAENAYAEQTLRPATALQETLFDETKARIVETDVSAPSYRQGWWYWFRTTEGRQYGSWCRRRDPNRELTAGQVLDDARAGDAYDEVVLDENELAVGSDYFALGVFDLDLSQNLLAYATDKDGSERFSLRIRDLARREDLADAVEGVYYGSAWSADSKVLFYVRPDEAVRPYQVWRHTIGTPASEDELAFEEPDEHFFVGIGTTRSDRFILVQSESKTTSEVLYLDSSTPAGTFASVLGREPGVEYDAEHGVWSDDGDSWVIRTNRPDASGPATDFAVWRKPIGGGNDSMKQLIPHRAGTKVDQVDVFSDHLVVYERARGSQELRVLKISDGQMHLIEHPDPVYSLHPGSNPEWDSSRYRYGYTSLITPVSDIEYDLEDRTRTEIKSQPVLGYDPSRFETERIWATAVDGTRVPISVVSKAGQSRDGTAPCVLYGYGAYEIPIDPAFSVLRLNLLERGVSFAIAHVRGGGEMGRTWYEQGRLKNKPNTFTDFISCAEHLLADGWVDPDRMAIRGGSAGGLLMGAVTNMRPDLWRAVVAEVPFVDVLTTMSDASLPLTVTEWEEWGDPVHDADFYELMKSYSPYDNVAGTDYPAMYVTAGLNDPRVGYWEPAKWVAKLRVLGTGQRPLLLRTELEAGHAGPSGRYSTWKDEAKVHAFLLMQLGVEPGEEPDAQSSMTSPS